MSLWNLADCGAVCLEAKQVLTADAIGIPLSDPVQVFAEIRTFAPVEKVTHSVVHIEDSFRIQHVMSLWATSNTVSLDASIFSLSIRFCLFLHFARCEASNRILVRPPTCECCCAGNPMDAEILQLCRTFQSRCCLCCLLGALWYFEKLSLYQGQEQFLA